MTQNPVDPAVQTRSPLPPTQLLTSTQRHEFLKFPELDDFLLGRHYQLLRSDLQVIQQAKTPSEQLGLGVLITVMRHLGRNALHMMVPEVVLQEVAGQIGCQAADYGTYLIHCKKQHRPHVQRVKEHLGFESFGIHHRRDLLDLLYQKTRHIDNAFPLMAELLPLLVEKRILMPKITVLEGMITEALQYARQFAFQLLNFTLRETDFQQLEAVLEPDPEYRNGLGTRLGWLRETHTQASVSTMLENLKRLEELRKLPLPWQPSTFIARNRLEKLTRESRVLETYQLRDFEPVRRTATLSVMLMDLERTLTDRVLEDHRKLMLGVFNKCETDHLKSILQAREPILESLNLTYTIGKILLEAKQTGENPLPKIEGLVKWEDLIRVMDEGQKITETQVLDS
ncbi:DUF4158 domain-containing protein [Deinococcus roseus]|uniref:DUF4158 domain-containing protein n=1 Tax=Deinococcus roseus TaxID=392414 RepID=A0ABQ2DLE0_9DEIO|nr:DUF4158 domain-containing protein [Deinococcus roseus]GGJ59201.1 hypothetical protein GCM10008938_51620 [Deinococcus roseus]